MCDALAVLAQARACHLHLPSSFPVPRPTYEVLLAWWCERNLKSKSSLGDQGDQRRRP